YGSGAELPQHTPWFFYLQRLCNHCTYPACLAACPRNAIYKRPEDGIVLIDQARCRGYRKCVEQCPYKKPMYRATTRVSEKCIGCYPRIEGSDPLTEGLPMETRCMAVCPGKIRLQGLVKIDKKTGQWEEDPDNPIYYMVNVAKVALPLYPQFGTEPNGYYIPPRWVPREYLRQMFGPGVDHAIETYLAPPRELLALLQLFRTTQRIIFKFRIEKGRKVKDAVIGGKKWSMYDDTVIGYDRRGKEIVRLSVMEPFHVRPAKYLNSI
ncbi:MAG TPA: 4Fe-4S dicluster domain-containing protein, partial [Actinomycetota bacterium]|nr:4Fe-4S dicluster domain-containing protein [Actinomycetota bacterium]